MAMECTSARRARMSAKRFTDGRYCAFRSSVAVTCMYFTAGCMGVAALALPARAGAATVKAPRMPNVSAAPAAATLRLAIRRALSFMTFTTVILRTP